MEGMKSKETRNNFDVKTFWVVNRKGREDAERIKNKEVCKV